MTTSNALRLMCVFVAMAAGPLVYGPATPAFADVRDSNAVKTHVDVKLRDVISALFHATPVDPVYLSKADLSGFDLSGINFKRADLSDSLLFGTNLSNSDLRDTNLSGAVLNRAVVIRTSFVGANLFGCSIMRPTVFSDLNLNRDEAPNFSGANLASSRITGNLDGTKFRGAKLDRLNFEPHEPRADISFFPRNFCRGCDFTGASLRDANLYDASFVMASFVNADLSGANLARGGFTKADFTGADLTGANFTGANLESAILVDVRGLDRAIGLGAEAQAHENNVKILE